MSEGIALLSFLVAFVWAALGPCASGLVWIETGRGWLTALVAVFTPVTAPLVWVGCVEYLTWAAEAAS